MKEVKLYFFVDVRGWAFDSIAQKVREGLAKHLDVEIVYTEDFSSYNECCRFIEKHSGKGVCFHFFWRGYLLELLRFIAASKLKRRKSLAALKMCTVTTHVPDHLYSSQGELMGSMGAVFSFVDGFFTTSEKLFSIYDGCTWGNQPWGVIHDNPAIHVEYVRKENHNDPLKVVWVGNSEWGKHLGEYDYKGFKTVVEPAIKVLKKEIGINALIFDKAVSSTPKNQIDAEFVDADIVLISSREEGTPLPLIEAMAAGCAVVTTDVGIAREVLPVQQEDFVCARTASAFINAILALDKDRKRLQEIKDENRKAYENMFSDESLTVDKWLNFLNAATESRKEAEKEKVVDALVSSPLRTAAFGFFFWLSSRLSAVDFVKDLVKKNSFLSGVYHRFYSWLSGQDRISFFGGYDTLLDGKKFITIYSPYYLGVRNSTLSYFGDHAVPFPVSQDVSPETLSHPDMEGLVDSIARSGVKSVVYSGGPALHRVMCEMLAEKAPWVKQFFGWHGSPAQWSDWHQLDHFNSWASLHKRGLLSGVVTFKKDLEVSLGRMGIDSWHVMNFIPDCYWKDIKEKGGAVRIGLFAAAFSWFKNPYPQLVSLLDMEGVELHSNLGEEALPGWMKEHVGVVDVPQKMPHQAFKDYLKTLDVVLYVTNTECSPLIALEALSVGVPCIVGPAGNIYKGNDLLESLLVEPEVDSPESIRARVVRTLDEMEAIQAELPAFIENYNFEASGKQAQLYSILEAG